MNQALVAAQQLLTSINDIQPIVSVKGLTGASATLRDMKKNASVVIAALSPIHPRLYKIVESCKADMNSAYKEMIASLPLTTPGEQITDAQLAIMGMAADNFANRCDEYMLSREQLNQMKKHNVNGGVDVN